MSGNVRQSIYMGLGPQAFAGPGLGSGAALPFPLETYQTPLLDLTKTYSNIELLPARPGFYPVIISSMWLIESHSGTQTTPPTIQAGNDLNHVNIIPLSATRPSNANVNAIGQNGICTASAAAANTVQKIIGVPVFFDLTVPAVGTGGYSCFGHYVLIVCWMAVDGV